MAEKEYLKRVAGISLELLKSYFHKNKIEYHIIQISGDKTYFRDVSIKVKVELEKVFQNYKIIPSSNDATRKFNKEEGYIELNAFYNLVIRLNSRPLEIDENYVEITPEYAKDMRIRMGEIPRGQPKDRIKIYEFKERF